MSKELLVGFTGPAGCGKDTAAANLQYFGNFQSYSFAQPMKRALSEIFSIEPAAFDDRHTKEIPIDWIGKSPRYLMQTLGTEWGRKLVDDQIWVTLMLRRWEVVRASTNPRLVVPDVRFDNEAATIINAGGTVWRIRRENLPPVLDHASERGVSNKYITGTITNEGSVDDLAAKIQPWITFLTNRYGK